MALQDLETIREYISRDNVPAAQRISLHLRRAGDSLSEFPGRGRKAKRGAREWMIVYPYIIRYRVLPTHIDILRVKHGAQRPE